MKSFYYKSLLTSWERFLNQKKISLQPLEKKIDAVFYLQVSKIYMKEWEF